MELWFIYPKEPRNEPKLSGKVSGEGRFRSWTPKIACQESFWKLCELCPVLWAWKKGRSFHPLQICPDLSMVASQVGCIEPATGCLTWCRHQIASLFSPAGWSLFGFFWARGTDMAGQGQTLRNIKKTKAENAIGWKGVVKPPCCWGYHLRLFFSSIPLSLFLQEAFGDRTGDVRRVCYPLFLHSVVPERFEEADGDGKQMSQVHKIANR